MSGIGYQWFNNGNPIAGANAISFTPSVNGTYTVEVTHASSCTLLSDEFIVNTLSLNSTESLKAILYPNPAKDFVMISGIDGEFDYVILSLDDKTIQAGRTTDTIDLSLMQSGIYLLQVNTLNYRLLVDRNK